MSEKRKKRLVVMAPGGRQSKRVRSIPPAQVVPEPHVPENISLVAANSTGCDNALQAESTPVVKNRDWSYAYDGGLDEDETEGNPIPEDDPMSEGLFLCYPQDCCTNICIPVQYCEFELQYLHKEVAR